MNENFKNIIELNNIIYQLDENLEAKVIGNTIERIMDIEISEKITYQDLEYTIVEIGIEAFKDCQFLEFLGLPSTIRKVSKGAFMGSSVKILDFMQMFGLHEVYLEEKICYGCIRLESVHLAAGIKDISDYSFYGCVRLIDINTPIRTIRIGTSAFNGCISLFHFDFHNDIELILEKSFYNTGLNYAEVGYRVKHVGDKAFASIRNLRTLVIISQNAFFKGYLISDDNQVIIYIKGIEKSENVLKIKNLLSNVHYFVIDDFMVLEKNGVKYMSFSNDKCRVVGYNENNLLSHTKIAEKIGGSIVYSFQPKAFYYCQKIKSCSFPKTIDLIKGKVFEGCKNLKKVIFNSDLTFDEAKWVVFNENVKIVIKNKG